MRQKLVCSTVICFVIVLLVVPVSAKSPGPDVTIFRDGYGVPHVYSGTVYGLFYGYGYAIATDRLFQMEMSKRSVKGTVSEVLGPGYVAFDKGVRSNYRPDSIVAQYKALQKKYKDIFDGYAAGMNARIEEVKANPTLMPKQFFDFDFQPTKWTPTDVIMIFVGTMCNRYSDFNNEVGNKTLLDYLNMLYDETTASNIFNQLKWINDPGAPTTVPSNSLLARNEYGTKTVSRGTTRSDLLRAEHERIVRDNTILATIGLPTLTESPLASNVWIVGNPKTKGKGAILMNGPQFSHFNPGYVYEIGLHGAGFDLVGSAPFGYPNILFGHNGNIVWGSTAGVGDLVDYYEEVLNPANPYQYWYKGEWRDMEKRTDTIIVRGEPPQTVDIYRTVHGFVVQFDIPNSRAYSKKRSWEGYEVESQIGWIECTRAHNFAQWRNGASMMAISINWYYADKQGNIGYTHLGKYPIRPDNYDHRLPAPGTGDSEWLGILPFEKNPMVYNPAQGYIVNWNNKPAAFWNDADFYNWGSVDRVNAIIQELEKQDTFTKEEIWNMNRRLSHVDLSIGYLMPFLEDAVKLYPLTQEAAAVDILKNWDRYRWDLDEDGYYDSPAQTIFEKWLSVMLRKTFQDDLQAMFGWVSGTGYPPGNAPSTGTKVLYHALLGNDSTVPNNYDFFNGVAPSTVIFDSLTETVTTLATSLGPVMSTWLTPVTPLLFSYRNFLGIPQASPDENLYLPVSMNRGTQNDLVELRPWGVEGYNVCPPGASGFVAPDGTRDEHYSDQMEMYRTFQYKPMYFYFKDVADNAVSSITLNPK